MEIKIADNEYILKYTLRGLFVYEQITGTTFSPDKLLNEYTLFYSILLANNAGFHMTFDDFINACEENAHLFLTFRKWLIETLKQKALLTMENPETDSDSKKKD